jgi:hypothetical protein
MRYPKTARIAAAGSLALLAAPTLPASATPYFAPAGSPSPDLILVKGGGGGGGGGHGGAHMGGNNAHVARGGNFNGNVGRHEHFANNWNGNWNGNWHGHGHHHRYYYNRFYAYPYFYGGYYPYNGYYGSCGWLYRRAVATGSRYWWNRYYACVG